MEWFEDVFRQDPNDFRLRFLTDAELAREQALKERTLWFEQVNLPNKQALCFEFEMLLLGIERFFKEKILGHGDYSHLMTKNFVMDVGLLHETIRKVHVFTNRFLMTSDDTLAFRQFIDRTSGQISSVTSEPGRGRSGVLESLYHLNLSFKAYLGLVEGLLAGRSVSYSTFDSLGFLINRDLQGNPHFNPRYFEQFTPLYDRIHSDAVHGVIRSITDERLRHGTSLVLLVLFRILNYLRFIPRPCSGAALVKKSMVILSIISTEMKNLQRYLEEEGAKPGDGAPIRQAFTVIAKILKNEHERVYHQEIENFSFSVDRGQRVTSSIDIAHWILTNTCHQSVMTCLRVFDQTIQGRDLFSDYFPPEERAMKLRRDLYLFDHMLDAMERAIRGESGFRVAPIFRSILEFTTYFETVEFQALRLAEYRRFREFSSNIWEIVEGMKEKRVDKRDVEAFKLRITTFRPSLWQTILEVNKRVELVDRPVDSQEIKVIFDKYLEQVQQQTPATAS